MKTLITLLALSFLPLFAQADVPNMALIRQDVLTMVGEGFKGTVPAEGEWSKLACQVRVKHQLLKTEVTVESEGEAITFSLSHDSKVTSFISNLQEAPRLSYRTLTVRKAPEYANEAFELEIIRTENDREVTVSIEYPDAYAANSFGSKTFITKCSY